MGEHTSRMTPEFEASLRRKQAEDERTLLAQDLRQKYLRKGVPDHVAKRVFDKAWEDGHASGTHEVEIHYDEISEIVNAAFAAGVRHEREGK